ncbi:uncharacterized protein LOC114519043 [Dendronephthya gigantea]|uniref:uncharacterized protein LOC114519043 n=1 Tax=Dendronephthya gigantea TaxID=151771 RepID=UPI00106C0FBA|nr:uncharacterized protein LOC114519043 [Dendronephthya gigantea]
MEVLRKRRSSTEVQELMNAVRSDYEFFSAFEKPLQNVPSAKRQCSPSDDLIKYAVVKPKPRFAQEYNLPEPITRKYSENISTTDGYKTLAAHANIPHQNRSKSLSCEQSHESRISLKNPHFRRLERSREQRESLFDDNFDVHDQNRISASKEEQIFQKISPDFWASQNEKKSLLYKSPFTSKTSISGRQPLPNGDLWPEVGDPGELICLSSEPIFRNADDLVARKRRMTRHISTGLETLVKTRDKIPPLLVRVDTNTSRSEESPTSRCSGKRFRDFCLNEPMDYEQCSKIQRTDWEKEKRTVEMAKKAHSTVELTKSDSEDDLVIVDSPTNSSSSQLSYKHSPTKQKAQDVTDVQANEKPDKSKEIVPMKQKSEGEKGQMSLGPADELWPDYVITRVGSLLWLDKEIVYPITLDEMRRRIQDPENFSFQMLIAYVRHSRAKGRQFLDYWKCQPSGRTSRPNVLSKLCEADAKELVKGIQKVNEEYFPRDTLAKNISCDIIQEKGSSLTEKKNEGEKRPKDFTLREKVKAIENSRSLFKILEKTLNSTQEDERFNTFNVASHNAGVENIKNSLRFLDSIFERIQSYVKGNGSSNKLPALEL